MKASRYTNSRQKACQQCSSAKAKCNRQAISCTRCLQRGLLCTYNQTRPRSPDISNKQAESAQVSGPSSVTEFRDAVISSASIQLEDEESRPIPPAPVASSSSSQDSHSIRAVSGVDSVNDTSDKFEALHFSDLDLVCPINVDDISNRWLNTYVPLPGQIVKSYPPNVATFIFRMLKSYAAATVHGRGLPPFVHPAQMGCSSTSRSLSACLRIICVCDGPMQAGEDVVADMMRREMSVLYENRNEHDEIALLATFQAYLLYCVVYFFQLRRHSDPFLREAMLTLLGLAALSSRQGLVSMAEQRHARPLWEAWIVAEAKRRTLFATYLFDSVLAHQDGLPTFLGTELQGLLAPGSKALWRAQTRREWEAAYNRHLVEWNDAGLRIDELWPIPADLDEEGCVKRRNRIDLWLEGVDEFGTMMYAVTSCTHGA